MTDRMGEGQPRAEHDYAAHLTKRRHIDNSDAGRHRHPKGYMPTQGVPFLGRVEVAPADQADRSNIRQPRGNLLWSVGYLWHVTSLYRA